MQQLNPKVDAFLRREKRWKKEFETLREIILGCGLAESYKWMHPCYMIDGKNVVLMHGFKEYCALLFPQGVLLKDPQGILVQQTPNVQTARQIRFTGWEDIQKNASVVKAYVREAAAVEKSGMKAQLKKTSEFPMPPELERKFSEMPPLKAAFEALTPGRQRGYLLYFSSAKQAKTREARIEKCADRILDGLGLDD
jgi:uncharacterized protein YdeI (YjbR/CyaY-like superfamily)